MEIPEQLPNFLRAGAIFLPLPEVQQHVHLKEWGSIQSSIYQVIFIRLIILKPPGGLSTFIGSFKGDTLVVNTRILYELIPL